MYIETKSFGKCEIICCFKDIAIVELKNNSERYVVTIGISQIKNGWNIGYYCRNLKEAGKVFNNILEEFYMVSFKI